MEPFLAMLRLKGFRKYIFTLFNEFITCKDLQKERLSGFVIDGEADMQILDRAVAGLLRIKYDINVFI